MPLVTTRKHWFDHRPTRKRGSSLMLALAVGLLPGLASATPMMDLQLELVELVEQEDDASVDALAARVEDGLPPAALSAMLDACREHPRDALEPLIRSLATHRTSAIRGRALLAWAGLGPTQSVDAIEAAADDADAGVRRIAVVLQRLHPSERADAIVSDLLARDQGLAEELAGDELAAPQGEEGADS